MRNNIKEKIREKIASFIFHSVYINQEKNTLLAHIDYLLSRTMTPHKNKKVIYTCITGAYDSLILHNYISKEYDYVCYTDNQTLLKYNFYGIWKICPLMFNELDNALNNRWHKTHPHILFPEYDISIYIDGNICFNSSYFIQAAENKKSPIVLPLHWKDSCVYEEVKNVLETIVPSGGEKRENVEKMQAFLISEKMPHDYGLNENNFIYREHNNPRIIKIMDMWWFFINKYTKRDQLSLSYVLWKNNVSPNDISIPNLRNSRKDDVDIICHNK